MHKGYKCLDCSTGRIYVSHDVIFDKKVFPFDTPGVTIDILKLNTVSSTTHEPAIQNTDMRTYDISLLPIELPSLSSAVSMQE
jgi:hypothetical protein